MDKQTWSPLTPEMFEDTRLTPLDLKVYGAIRLYRNGSGEAEVSYGEVQQRFNVARSSLRDALNRLEAAGYIERHQQIGELGRAPNRYAFPRDPFDPRAGTDPNPRADGDPDPSPLGRIETPTQGGSRPQPGAERDPNPRAGRDPALRKKRVNNKEELKEPPEDARAGARETPRPSWPTPKGGDSAAELWTSAKKRLEVSLPAATYRDWIQATKGIACDGVRLMVQCHSMTAVDFIEGRLRKRIEPLLPDLELVFEPP